MGVVTHCLQVLVRACRVPDSSRCGRDFRKVSNCFPSNSDAGRLFRSRTSSDTSK